LREDVPGTPRIVAYYVEKAGPASTPEALRALLAEDMPEYMIPSAWMRLDALPLSPNGKLDRAVLPKPDPTQIVKEEYVAPSNDTEVGLTKIFAEVLGVERVGITADLLKLGADSIQLFQITARANRANIKITAKQFLHHCNSVVLAGLVNSGSANVAAASANSALPSLSQFKRSRKAS
jgi:aryl carrier-like protein